MNAFLAGATPPSRVLVIAHRGARTLAPENSIPAFEKARELGADMIEFDVQIAADGVPVVFHDSTLDRLTDVRDSRFADRDHYPVAQFTSAQLGELDLARRFTPNPEDVRLLGDRGVLHPSGARTSIPTLEDLLAWASGTQLTLNLEMKSQAAAGLATVLGIVRAHGLVERVLVSSFDHSILVAAKREMPEIATAVLSAHRLVRPIRYVTDWVGADAYHPGAAGDADTVWTNGALDHDLFREAREIGVRVHPWTVNDPGAMRALIAAGASGIITDRPHILHDLVAGECR